jgi:outer membrane immunogenic protein
MKHFLLAGAAVSAGAFLSAHATAQTFTGPRIEAHAGWDQVKGKLTYTDTDFPEDNFTEKRNTDGVVYGGGIGYDMPVGDGWIVGIQGNFDFSDNKKCEPVFGDDEACFKVKRDLEAGARIGRVMSERFLLYVSGGYVNGKAKVTYVDDLDASNNFTFSDKRDGYRVAVGSEVAFGMNLYGKVEYRYTNYNDYEVSAGTESLRLGFDRHQVLGGLGIRF